MTDFQNRFQEILNIFDNFITFNRGSYSNGTDIVKLCDTAGSLEEICNKLQEKKLWDPFSKKLHEFLLARKWTCSPERDILLTRKACDVVLCKTLTDRKLSDLTVNICVERYLVKCDRIRFKSASDKLIQTRKVYLRLSDISDSSIPLELEARFIFASLIKLASTVSKEVKDPFTESVNNLLTSEEEGTIPILLYILSFEEDNKVIKALKSCIVSSLSKTKNIDIGKHLIIFPKDKVRKIILNYPELMVVALDFILAHYLEIPEERTSQVLNLFHSIGGPFRRHVVNFAKSNRHIYKISELELFVN